MEEFEALKERLETQRPVCWAGFPDLELYMDQVISYLPRQLIQWEHERLTPAMVNNYIKDGLLPRADGKKYSKTHLAYLTSICALKQVLSVREIGVLLSAGQEGRDTERLYEHFCQQLDSALQDTAQGLPDVAEEGDLPRLALGLALRSYADKLACQRILDLMQGEINPRDKRKRKYE